MKFRTLCAIGAMAALSACGGDNPPPPPTGGAPTPAPAPTPSPTPTPTPTPTPVSYTAFADIEQGTFASACAQRQTSVFPAEVEEVRSFGDSLVFDYTRSSKTWKVTGRGVDFEVDQSDLRSSPDFLDFFIDFRGSDDSESLNVFNPSVLTPFGNYVRLTSVSYNRPSQETPDFACVIGVPTDTADTLIDTRSRYSTISFFGNSRVNRNGGTTESYFAATPVLNLQFDPTTRTVTLSFDAEAQSTDASGNPVTEIDFGSFQSTATLAAGTNNFRGELTTPGGDVVGMISGSLFGPRGEEIGLVYGFNIGLPNGESAAVTGQVAGGDPGAV